jgi:hypothetical protein
MARAVARAVDRHSRKSMVASTALIFRIIAYQQAPRRYTAPTYPFILTHTDRSFPTLTKAQAQVVFRCSSHYTQNYILKFYGSQPNVCLTAPPDDEIKSSFRCHGIYYIRATYIYKGGQFDIGHTFHILTHHKGYTSCSGARSFDSNRASLRFPFANAIENGV